MTSIIYESSPKYYYKIKKDEPVRRISKKEFDKKYNLKRSDLKVGDLVKIIVKPYKNGKTVTGKIKKILTNKNIHTRGHKVMLEDGTVGRMVSIKNN